MKKIIAIIAGEPNSISSEIIFKAWEKRSAYKHVPFFIIGSIKLLYKQAKKLKYKIKIKKINSDFQISDLLTTKLPVYDIDYFQKNAFEKISVKSNQYIFKSFNSGINFYKNKKIFGIINCPISKEHLLKNKFNGVTEFLSKKLKCNNSEVMLIYNSKLSTSPITTHIPLRKVAKSISKSKIVNKVKTINNFFINKLKFKPKIGILGLNPHNYSGKMRSEEKRIIKPAIVNLIKKNINVIGPIPTDTSFLFEKKLGINVIVGMYHDQVLTPFKTIYEFNAINVTLGLPLIRVSPDHGVGKDIMGKGKANSKSLIESIKFFNLIK